LFDALNRAAQGRCLTIHNQESEAENQFYGSKEGDFLRLYATLGLNIDFFSPYQASSLATYLPWLSLPRSVLLVHNVATSADDIVRVRTQSKTLDQESFWCLCPGANLYIQQALPPVGLLRKEGCVITLGTDSLASNYGLNILSEMKMIQDEFPEVPLEELLNWATSNGARALHIGDRFGSFGKEKQPGVLALKHLEAGRISGQTTVTRLL
jgi:cytosine/adenosine deaminase-related metal-dependent hydrolase